MGVGRVEDVGAREDVEGRERGVRRVDAADGGGTRAPEGLGTARCVLLLGIGRRGGGIRADAVTFFMEGNDCKSSVRLASVGEAAFRETLRCVGVLFLAVPWVAVNMGVVSSSLDTIFGIPPFA